MARPTQYIAIAPDAAMGHRGLAYIRTTNREDAEEFAREDCGIVLAVDPDGRVLVTDYDDCEAP